MYATNIVDVITEKVSEVFDRHIRYGGLIVDGGIVYINLNTEPTPTSLWTGYTYTELISLLVSEVFIYDDILDGVEDVSIIEKASNEVVTSYMLYGDEALSMFR